MDTLADIKLDGTWQNAFALATLPVGTPMRFQNKSVNNMLVFTGATSPAVGVKDGWLVVPGGSFEIAASEKGCWILGKGPITIFGVTGFNQLSTPAFATVLAARASQGTKATLVDQGPQQNVLPINTNLYPVAFLASAAVTLGAFRSPSVPNGWRYEVTTAGTNGATEPSWPTTEGATVTSGTATYTCRKGAFFLGSDGRVVHRTLSNTYAGGSASETLVTAANFNFDLRTDSCVIHLRFKYDYAASGQGVLPILSSRLNGTGAGILILGTGADFNDLRFLVGSANNEVLSTDTKMDFNRKPLDGQYHDVVWFIDGPMKTSWVYIDGKPITQGDMFDYTGGLNPNGMNLASITGSTVAGPLTLGGHPGAATSTEIGVSTVDVLLIKNGSCPANLMGIVEFCSRAGESFIPEALGR